ncbi:MAG: Ribosome association toxin RatA [Hyphomicrobiaceae bacterium hypho_1]
MPAFATKRKVPYSPTDMFALVADIEKYPDFVPLCESLEVRKNYIDHQGFKILVADMTCGYKAVRENFTSLIRLDTKNQKIFVEYVDGPFQYLENTWSFIPNHEGTIVSFDIRYEFKSMMLQILMGALFDKAFRRFASAFEDRAKTIYHCKL